MTITDTEEETIVAVNDNDSSSEEEIASGVLNNSETNGVATSSQDSLEVLKEARPKRQRKPPKWIASGEWTLGK